MSTQSIPSARSFEMVTPGEFQSLQGRNGHRVHNDILEALTAMKSMMVGEGVKVPAPGTFRDVDRRRKSAVHLAGKMKMPITTYNVNGWLYIQKTKAPA